MTLCGVIPCSSLYATCFSRRRSVSSMARRMESVILSAYRMARPSMWRAARPIVWMREPWERRNPSLSASRIATRDTSGRSRPSRSRLIPMRTSYSPLRRSRSRRDTLQRLDLRVHVTATNTHLGVVVREILRHALRECGDEHALVSLPHDLESRPVSCRSDL